MSSVSEPTLQPPSAALYPDRFGAPRADSRRTSIGFLVRSLAYGGAERQLVTLATALHARGHRVIVMPFYANGPLEAELREAGVRVRGLEKRGRWDVTAFLTRLHAVIREERLEILHGYLGIPNIVASVMRAAFPRIKVVWGERASNMDLSHYDWLSRASALLARTLSRFPDLIIVNSRAGFEHVVRSGYPRKHVVVIPNGIDTQRFAPDPAARRRLRRVWNVGDEERLIGLVGRLDPVKDHRTFLTAAAMLTAQHEHLRFVCVGDGDPRYARAMRSAARELGLGESITWVGARSDMSAVYNAFDIACSSSESEGFPNVVAEAMACGVPCVVTDVGDSAWVLGRPASVAPPGDPRAFADRIADLLAAGSRESAAIGGAGRERIITFFSIAALIHNTERAIAGVVVRRPA